MSAFDAEVAKVQAAQEAVWKAETAVEARRRAVARAWRLRPGGVEWADLLRVVNSGLPPAAWLTVATLRNDERLGRPK